MCAIRVSNLAVKKGDVLRDLLGSFDILPSYGSLFTFVIVM